MWLKQLSIYHPFTHHEPKTELTPVQGHLNCLIAYQSNKSQVSIINVESDFKNSEYVVKFAVNDRQKN